VPFDLYVNLISPDAAGRRHITGTVKIARPTVRPGEVRDLGDLPAVAPPKEPAGPP
jgi:hypothetical protein